MTMTKYKLQYGVSIFQGKRKIEEKKFKSEKDMAFFLYKNESTNK